MTPEHSTYVVVGAGLAGAATAWQLTAAGHEVTVVERGRPADPAGSSHGSARILRYAYPSQIYTDLVTRARELWTELEQQSGQRLITPTGALDFGAARHPAALAQVLEQCGVDHELLSASAASERWPGLAIDSPVLWHPDAGVIDAETSVTSMVQLATAAGARLKTGWELARVDRREHGYLLTSAAGTHLSADRIVVAAGGWLPELLSTLGLPQRFLASIPAIHVRQEQAFHFPYRDCNSSTWPAFIHKTDQIQTYGLPGGRDAGYTGQKVAEFNGGRRLASAREQNGQVDPIGRARLIDYTNKHLPGLVPEPYAETTCLFTNTPTEDFILDRCEGITIVAPCSGHGAKFAPLVGALTAGVASAATAAAGRSLVPREFLPALAPSATRTRTD